MALAFILLSLLPLAHARLAGFVLSSIGIIFLTLTVLWLEALRPIEKIWMAFGERMSVVMTYVILTLTYFVVVTPLGIAMRLFRRPAVREGLDKYATTYWEPIGPNAPSSRPETPY